MSELIVSAGGVDIRRVQLKKPHTTLGRKSHNDIVFDNAVVSGSHCTFELTPAGDVYIDDAGSTNGTYVNGVPVTTRVRLRHRDVIVIGNFRVEFLSLIERAAPSTQSETNPMSLDALGLPGTTGALQAGLKKLTGDGAGQTIPLVKAVTTFGQPDGAIAAVSHRRDGYYAVRVGGARVPTLNGKTLGVDAVMLVHHDILDLSGAEYEFLLKGR